MPISKDEAQSLCSTTEWNTVETSHPPKLDSIAPAAAKKNANRLRRFLSKEENADGDKKRIALFTEALERLEAKVPDKDDNEKLTAKREKEKIAKDKSKELRDKRTDVRDKLIKKAEEEAAESEGVGEDGKALKSGAKNTSGGPKKTGKHTQGKIGSRKV